MPLTQSPPLIVASGVLHLVGSTPLVEITNFDTGPCRLFVKLENQNPGGSIKDRIAVSMIQTAERSGVLKPGGVIVEATAGNTGLGLALVAAAKNYRLIVVIPDKMSTEKIQHLHGLGADVRITRTDVDKHHPENYVNLARHIAETTPGAWLVDQFSNPANPLAHEQTTGPEIWDQMDGNVDAVVCGVGSGGTITGLSRYFARVSPGTEMILADPAGSSLAEYVRTGDLGPGGSYAVEGIGQSAVPPVSDLSRVSRAYTIPDAESFEVARALLRQAGILAGSSSGTLVAAALRYCREQTAPKRVATFICDTGSKYLSKMFNDFWMLDQGYLQLPKTGDIRDLILRRHQEGRVITVGPRDSLLTAYQRMRMADISQVPVLDEDSKPVGILDESDLLMAVQADEQRFRDPVSVAMTTRLRTLPPDASLESVYQIVNQGLVAMVMDADKFVGLITRTDLLNFMRRRLR
ncbi:MAG TPA: cystathionine beta-synthase [Bryobacteraceae bacterium]|nr:cystathionine beta-synthase [Bryobacteraceae bacterium]